MKWYVVDWLLKLPFILLSPLQIKEKLEAVNLFCISLYALTKFSSRPDSMSETIFPVWLGRDNFLLFFPFPPVSTARSYWHPSTSFSVDLSFPQLQPSLSFEPLLYHVLFFSSCNTLIASVRDTHAFPPKQVLNSNAAFICLIMLLLTSDLRAGSQVASYPI